MIELSSPPSPSSPSSTSSPSSSFTQYDVFLSFRGEDTRKTFTGHLYNAVDSHGIRTFIDDELPRGEEISPQLLKAIEDSKISIIVFSENYASSWWCLDELVKILECKKSKEHMVMPIFYKVDPSDVRKQISKFGDAFEGLIQSKFKDNEEKVLIWKTALTEAGNLSGRPFKEGGCEAKFINEVVKEISVQVLNNTDLAGPAYPVGIKSCVTDVNKLLGIDGNGHRTVGIWGTAGIGKTTIAKAVYNSIASKFEGACFLTNVRETSSVDGGLLKLQEALLCQVLRCKGFQLFSVDQGINVIKQRLSRKRILVILDDVNQLDNLEKLAGTGWFGEASRVIVTTRDGGLLARHGIESIYEVKKLAHRDALELFSMISFERKEPPGDYLALSERAIAYAQHLPLALTILGSHLRNKKLEYWHATLGSYEADPYFDIQKILRTSYDGLNYHVQQVFLDIACFFKGKDVDYVIRVLKGPKLNSPENCIQVLVENAIITLRCNMIWMHDLLEQMGKDIVQEESPYEPGKRSRLWFYDDVRQVLADNSGTSTVKGIMIKLPKHDEIPLNAESFSGMKNLQFFINRHARLCGDTVDYLSNKLRVIDWGDCQLQYLPSNFHPKELVVFNMPGGSIRRLEKLKNMSQLTFVYLRECQFLEKIPDLSGSPNIKTLNLSNCTSLVEIDDSVGLLDKLLILNLAGCVKLTRFATRLRLSSLECLFLRNCKRLESFPEIEVKMESLKCLDIAGSGVRELPSSIANFTRLFFFEADYCENPTITVNSQVSSSNSELQLLPNQSQFILVPLDCWSTLTLPDLSGNNFVNLPRCFSKFVNLQSPKLRDCKSLPEVPEQVLPPRVKFVLLDDCKSLEGMDQYTDLSLMDLVRLRDYDITEDNQVYVSSLNDFNTSLPDDEVSKSFNYRKDAKPVNYSEIFFDQPKVKFEIPPNLKWETIILVLRVVIEPYLHKKDKMRVEILVNENLVNNIYFDWMDVNRKYPHWMDESQVLLKCIPLLSWHNLYMLREPLMPDNMCQVIFYFDCYMSTPVKMTFGVHLLGHQVADVSEINVVDQHQDNKLLSMPSASETILGKRPRHGT